MTQKTHHPSLDRYDNRAPLLPTSRFADLKPLLAFRRFGLFSSSPLPGTLVWQPGVVGFQPILLEYFADIFPHRFLDMAKTANATPYGGPYGRRLYVNVVDETARAEPDRPWVYAPRSSDERDGFRAITWRQHANAVNRAANWLVRRLGKPAPKSFPSLAYVGPNDARYLILFAAGTKAGYQIMFPSTRNNTESQVSLLRVTKCQKLLYGSEYAKRVQPWVREAGIGALEMLGLEQLLDDAPEPVHPYNETFESAEFDPVTILHTSGSTGTPKPIYCNQGLFCSTDNYHNFPEYEGFPFVMSGMATLSKNSYCPLPLFHAFGLYCFISIPTFWGKPMTLGIGDKPLTAESVVRGYEAAGCDALILPPSIVEDISKLDGGIEKLKKLSYVACGGGGISPEVGNDITSKGVRLNNCISSTEYAMYPTYWQTDYNNWDWFIFDNKQFGCRYDHVDDNIYEQTIVRHEPFQPIFYTFPDATEYKTGDLFEKHPTLPGHWRSQGRMDNIIVFSNGEKLNPVTLEATVTLHPDVRQALVVGHGYFQAGVILEPAAARGPLDNAQKEAFIASVWPVIEKANAATVEHGRVARHLVTVSEPKKPFLFSAKGSFRRGAAIKMYKPEIEALFSAQEVIEPAQLDTATREGLAAGIRSLFSGATPEGAMDDEDDFFLQGIDSLQVINLAKRITAGLRVSGVAEDVAVLAPRDVYAQSTVTKLTNLLFGRIHGTQSNGVQSQAEILQALVDKYSAGLAKRSDRPPAKSTGKTVLLTGSTGSLGSYFLHFLIHDPDVAKIVCLNRSEGGGRAKQLSAQRQRGLSTEFEKVVFLHADLSRSDLALEKDHLLELERSVDCIIHNAWPVNFNISVQSFEGHIRGVRHLIDLVQKAAVNASIIFISSIGTVDQWSDPSPIPETNLTDLNLASMGYGQSKQVGSMVLDTVAKVAGIPAAVVRLGQVAGPTTQQGSWNAQEWLPTIIQSSAHLGLLPDSLGSMTAVDWVPVDKVARTILDMATTTSQAADFSSGAKFFNLVNPRRTPWSTIAPAVVSFYQQRGKQLQLVSFADWVKAVETAPASPRLSAIKLLDTYKALSGAAENGAHPGFATEKSQQASKTLATMEAVTPGLMALWCQQWNFGA
ncbi:Male sterility, NAD-binding protein [Cordyceps fumosorosea ARSEF 2679]|uniref:Male sterility, NAD-binding protein n=1 Tax=Cordyceps fumosorosea (strain ARSEF 2679) TaxID=1081104 RepID=A0A167N4F6_CORFA|nr:Male sterility, NAD-binding protein [Cordyceps fumosorosea ARSEF 2679]OAA55119.1 Male sterility, NAD-binding protein [Cordyceps fumosorosea ARSEF 2679]